ncbi:MAG: V-type ATP synthase subunit I [Nitrospinota bacterium]
MIVPMERIRIVGTQADMDRCIKRLEDFGGVHITESIKDSFLAKAGLEQGMSLKAISEKIKIFESLLFEVRTSLALLRETSPQSVSRHGFKTVQRDWYSMQVRDEINSMAADIRQAADASRALNEEILEVHRYRLLFEEFQPLIEQLASSRNIEIYGLHFKEKSEEIETGLEKKLDSVTKGAFSILRGKAGKTGHSMLLVYPASFHDAVHDDIFMDKSHRIETVHVPERFEKESFASTLSYLFKREYEAVSELRRWREALQDYAVNWKTTLQNHENGIKYELKRLRIKNFMALSPRTFWISGWIRSEDGHNLRKILDRELDGKVQVYLRKPSPSEFGEVPVQLRNPEFAGPFERLLTFFPPPMYGSVDPTLLIMVFFPLFFGLMLGDVGYGLILAIMGWLIRKKKGTVAVWNDIATIVYSCAITTAFFGILFGEFFGKLWFGIGLTPPLFDRKIEILHLLAIVIILGGIQLVTGKFLAIKASIAGGDLKRTIVGVSDLVIICSVLWLTGTVLWDMNAGSAPAVLVVAASVKTVAGGVWELLELTKLFTNLLSYARLMALGIASVILADMADDLYLASDIFIFGLIGAVLVHLLNFVLGVFSPTIQAIRLHYVEFFNQFYRHGFVKFSPFK